MKKYGIYLLYAPNIDLKKEGLGRLLGYFIQAAQEHKKIKFVIACPSWQRESLLKLFHDFDIKNNVEVISPQKPPILLQIYLWLKNKNKQKKKKKHNFTKSLKIYFNKIIPSFLQIPKKIVNTKSPVMILIIFAGLFIRIIGQVIYDAMLVIQRFFKLLKYISSISAASESNNSSTDPANPIVKANVTRILNYFNLTKSNIKSIHNKFFLYIKSIAGTNNLYNLIHEGEADLINNLISKRKDITAWYCPTALWPEFNNIESPRLICVPDIVLTEFPVGFAKVSNGNLNSFISVEKTINTGKYFVTFSDNVKWRTLVADYYIDPDDIWVIRHGSNQLNQYIDVFNNEDSTINLCRTLLTTSINNTYANNNISNTIKFIFYATQFRPNKNIISLLRAYKYLLRNRYIGHKLILTGCPNLYPSAAQFISEHHLENDVLCLHNLSTQSLAACYKLAEIAVNPSLSEGGFPFTFTEALSVDTPVVMANIPVTTEIIVNKDLQEQMLFDPYDWQDMAARIEWAIANKETLLAAQKLIYNELAKRTWKTVVDEHIAILDHISSIA